MKLKDIALFDINFFISSLEKEKIKQQLTQILKDIFNKAYLNNLIEKDLSQFIKSNYKTPKRDYIEKEDFKKFI